jgi:Leucine-rich repeat (LRR) protein
MNLPQLESLDLSHNRIHQLGPLSSLRSLAHLRLAKNKLSTLVEGTFNRMPNLTILDLESNEIQFVSPHVIRSMPALRAIHLSRNKLSTIPSATFTDLPALLEVF